MKKRTRGDDNTLSDYLQSQFARTARYNEATARFNYVNDKGVACEAGGLLSFLRSLYYPHYVDGAAPKGGRRTKGGKPSNPMQGIRVDMDMEALVRCGTGGDNLHPMSAALLAHWQSKGHSVVAAQVPVRIDDYRMTRADVLTRDNRTGKLYCWEVKTGMAASLHSKQGEMRGIPGNVPCTRANQWQLQSEYTRRALVNVAGIPIAGARVIQVYEARKAGGGICIKEHRTAPWLKFIH